MTRPLHFVIMKENKELRYAFKIVLLFVYLGGLKCALRFRIEKVIFFCFLVLEMLKNVYIQLELLTWRLFS